MSSDRVGISVVIPTLNRPDALRRAVASVAAQTHRAVEVIVIDDGSDPPVDTRSFEQLGVPIEVVRSPEPQGPAAARNTGVERASGGFVAFLDDDDLWHPRKLELVERCRGAHPDADVILHRTGFEFPGTVTGEPRVVGEPVTWMLRTQPPHIDGVVVRRSLHLVRPFDEELRGAADLDYLIGLAKAGARMVEIPEVLAVHGRREPSAVALEARIQGRLTLLERYPEIEADTHAASFFYLRLGHQYRRAGRRNRAIASFLRSLRARPNVSALKGLILGVMPVRWQRRLLP